MTQRVTCSDAVGMQKECDNKEFIASAQREQFIVIVYKASVVATEQQRTHSLQPVQLDLKSKARVSDSTSCGCWGGLCCFERHITWPCGSGTQPGVHCWDAERKPVVVVAQVMQHVVPPDCAHVAGFGHPPARQVANHDAK